MRSRYYSPEIKRFLSEDTFEGKYDELLNINLFEYANNNPVMNVDPEGEFVPLLVGGAYLAYRAWSAYDTYNDGKNVYNAWKRNDYKALSESGLYFGLGLVGGKGAKQGLKLARHAKDAKYYKAAKETKNAFEVAKEGGKHSGFYKQYVNKSAKEIQKGIDSINTQIAEHRAKIVNPEKYISGWKNLDPRQQQALINKKWPGDIQRQLEQKQILDGILKGR